MHLQTTMGQCACGVQCAVFDTQYEVHMFRFRGMCTVQVQVQCVMYTVQCEGYSVLPTKDKDLAVETGCFKLKCYLNK